jgi:hypothetical protein
MGYLNCCAVVRGTTILKIAVLLIATTTISITTTTILVFGLYVVVRRGLDSTMRFCPFALFLSYPSRIARKIFFEKMIRTLTS